MRMYKQDETYRLSALRTTIQAHHRDAHAPVRELVRPDARRTHEGEQLQRLLRAPVPRVAGDHGRPGHDAPVRHSVEHPSGGGDVAEPVVEDDELGAEVQVRKELELM